MELFVGNLAPETTDAELTAAFKAYGEVRTAMIKRDLFSGVSKGFGFVDMPGRQQSINAMAGLNGRDMNGKPLSVNEAQSRTAGGKRR